MRFFLQEHGFDEVDGEKKPLVSIKHFHCLLDSGVKRFFSSPSDSLLDLLCG
jgi:hypothetical protein